AAENGQFTYLGHSLQFEVAGKNGVAADIGQNREGAGCNYRASNREPIETIGEVYRVAGSDNHDDDKNDEWNKRQGPHVRDMCPLAYNRVRPELLYEGN